ncbi:MAG: hypothetical protein D6776_12295, partial [Planctomycetota bacterium]
MSDVNRITRKRLGELLVGQGLVTQAQVEEALAQQQRTGRPLGEVLVRLGYVTEADVAQCLCAQFGKPYIKPSLYDIPKEVLSLLPPLLMVEHDLVPLDRFGDTLTIAIGGMPTSEVLQKIETQTSLRVAFFISTATEVRKLLAQHFPDHIDPVTLEPRLDATAAITQAFEDEEADIDFEAIVDSALGLEPDAEDDMNEVTREIATLGEEDDNWEALFEEAEKN